MGELRHSLHRRRHALLHRPERCGEPADFILARADVNGLVVARGNRLLQRSPRANHVRRDRRQHEDGLEPLAKHENRDIQNPRTEIAMAGRIR